MAQASVEGQTDRRAGDMKSFLLIDQRRVELCVAVPEHLADPRGRLNARHSGLQGRANLHRCDRIRIEGQHRAKIVYG